MHCRSVHERLFHYTPSKAGTKEEYYHQQQQSVACSSEKAPGSLFAPQINKRSKEMQRSVDVGDLLYSDAMRRLETSQSKQKEKDLSEKKELKKGSMINKKSV